MLDFNKVSGWIDSNIKGVKKFTDIPSSAIDAAIAMYDEQTEEFNDSARAALANPLGKTFLDVIGGLKKPGYNPNAADRKENALGCVMLSSNAKAHEYKVVVGLVVPQAYVMYVKLDIDTNKKVLAGGVVFKNLYESPHMKKEIRSAGNGGDILDGIFELKTKFDNNEKVDPESKPLPGNPVFKPGEGLVADEEV